MKHTLRRTGEVCTYGNGRTIPVCTYDGWYKYDVHEGDTVIIHDGPTSSMYILKGRYTCKECPIRLDDNDTCAVAVKCKVTGKCRAVCRFQFGLHPIDEILEDL